MDTPNDAARGAVRAASTEPLQSEHQRPKRPFERRKVEADHGDPPAEIGDLGLSIDTALRIAEGRCHAVISQNGADRIAASHQRLQSVIAEGRVVYGITTGFGPLANRQLAPGQATALQEGLIAHLATGLGAPFSWLEARLILLARLSSITQGYSGASPRLVALLCSVLNSPFAPRMPSRGTVGASGDLTPLSHMALSLMGRAPFIDREGRAVPAEDVFEALDTQPLDLSARDGLALVNGTSAMTGVAVLNGARLRGLTGWATALSFALGEVMGARAEHWHRSFAKARPHPGQAAVTEKLADWSGMSGRLAKTPAATLVAALETVPTDVPIAEAMQEAYSLRCVPQILGAAADAVGFHNQVVERELNAATDNPIFPDDPAEPPALHGGNFMGSHVALASDLLANATLTVAQLAERQIARVTDERLNRGLPPFLHRGEPGLNSGFMGAQVTATALLAEMRTRAVPAAVQSISTNAANQDVVSMGTIAARNAALQLDDTAQILSILALAVVQGIDIVDLRGEGAGFSPVSRMIHAQVRALSAPLERDRPLSDDIARIAAWITAKAPMA
ncbi:MAG: aromatic amino acid ammonia-lyase [Pseudomonadota bacterium]